MIGLIWYAYTIVAAFIVLVARVAPRLTLPEILAASLPVGTIAGAWVVYLLACLTSAIGTHTVVGATLILAYAVYEHEADFRAKIGPLVREAFSSRQRGANAILAALLMVAGALFTPLYSTRMLPEEGEGRVYSGGSCWADLPLHMHVAESFLHGRNRDISWGSMLSPIFAGETMAYPFLPDFHAAVMVKIGSNLRWAFLATGLPLCLALVALLYTFALRLSRSPLGSVLAVLLVFGTGGMGGWHLAMRDGFSSAVNADVAQNDVTGEGKIVWFAFLPHVVLPQRGATFAYPLVLAVLTLVWAATEWGRPAAGSTVPAITSRERTRLLVLAGALAGSLPLVQAHSFIALGVMIGVYFVLDAHKWLADPRLLWAWAQAGAVVLLEAYPQFRQFRHHVNTAAGGNFLRFGWWFVNHDSGRSGGLTGFFRFWWLNLGPTVPLMLIALGLLTWEGARAYAAAARAAKALPNGWASLSDEYRKAAPELPAFTAATASTVAASAGSVGFTGGAAGGKRKAARKDGEEDEASPAAGGADSASGAEGGAGAAPSAAKVFDAFPSAAAAPVSASAPMPAAPHFLGHVWAAGKAGLKADTGIDIDALLDANRYRVDAVDRRAAFWLNALSLSGRSWDALKLGVGAFGVFLLGNYVMFQPWDRDNCKLWYPGLFVNAALVGSVLAAPIEALLGLSGSPGPARLGALVAPLSADAYSSALAEAAAGGAGAVPPEAVVSSAAVRRSAAAGRDAVTGKPVASGAATAAAGPSATRRLAALGGTVAAPVVLALACLSGFMMIAREFGLYHQLLDPDQFKMGAYIREHVPPKAVILHRDVHIVPSGCLAGRPSLISYNGWMWSHGYNYGDRDRDRNYALENALKDSDPNAYNAMRRWGVRYVLGEGIARHHRPAQQAYEDARARQAAGEENVTVPPFDADSYLDGQLKRIFSVGRYDLLEVQGYGFPPT